MFVKLKFWFSIFFAILFLANQLSAVWVGLSLERHKLQFQASLGKNLLSFSEEYLAKNATFRWIKPGIEFTVNHQMYDVKHTEMVKGVNVFHCKHDVHESKILKRLKKNLKEDSGKAPKGNANTVKVSIATLFCQSLPIFQYLIFDQYKTVIFCYSLLTCNQPYIPDTPPPQRFTS
ncbi:MAG TPA: hypothetical protein PKN57_06260 [Saprospiraceae bacterium]|nr:hypothetical protein [Saprospiraceae bacterium]MCC6687592.1 hypothetical protein [Saprospiraceae bacterium]HMX86292.1 hypothetical protein [Saprospiraceae bacterium]HMZ73515.1 hypothetical protein [Saprospiraceae bacterium]HNA94604.1 hypothetical protein [Saprospiraceae bacterium]